MVLRDERIIHLFEKYRGAYFVIDILTSDGDEVAKPALELLSTLIQKMQEIRFNFIFEMIRRYDRFCSALYYRRGNPINCPSLRDPFSRPFLSSALLICSCLLYILCRRTIQYSKYHIITNQVHSSSRPCSFIHSVISGIPFTNSLSW